MYSRLVTNASDDSFIRAYYTNCITRVFANIYSNVYTRHAIIHNIMSY